MDGSAFARFATTTYADVLTLDRVMDMGMRPLWMPIPRIAGPAYPVRCEPADNSMLHVAIHRAPPGSAIVCQAGDNDYAQAGGNVCAWAQKRGIAGIADEEGIVALPAARAAKDAVTRFEDWVRAHTQAIDDLVKKLGIDA